MLHYIMMKLSGREGGNREATPFLNLWRIKNWAAIRLQRCTAEVEFYAAGRVPAKTDSSIPFNYSTAETYTGAQHLTQSKQVTWRTQTAAFLDVFFIVFPARIQALLLALRSVRQQIHLQKSKRKVWVMGMVKACTVIALEEKKSIMMMSVCSSEKEWVYYRQ